MSFLHLSLCLLGLTQVHGQNYQVIFPGQEGTSAPVYNQQQDVQNPFGSQGRDAFSPGSNEVLGNYFNGNLPPTTVATNRYQPQAQQTHRLTPFGSSSGPSQLPFTSSYLAPPASTSLPRQTHFFGNNYDFFRQFHQPGFSIQSQPQQARQVSQPQQQQSTGQEVRNSLATFQPQTHDPFRSASPTTSHFFNNFGPSSGTPSQQTFTASPAPSTTAQSFTTTQYYNAKNNNNPFAFSVGGVNPSAKPSSTVFQPSRPIPPVYQPIQQTSPTAASFSSTPQSYISPSQPRHQQSSPTITYPLTEVKVNSQPTPTQNSFNAYEEAAKALGITHGLRVITTETLSAYPTVSLATTDSEVTERIPAIIVTSKRTTDAAVPSATEGPPSSSSTYSPPQTKPTTTNTPIPPSTIVTTTPSSVSTRGPIEQNYFVSSTPNYYDEPTSRRQPYLNDNYFPSSTTEAEDEPSYYVSSTPASVPVTYTGRTIANIQTTASAAAAAVPAAEQPRVEIVPHSRQREHLFRHSNRVVATNDLEVPYYVPQQQEQQQIIEEEQEQPIIIPRPTTTEPTTTTTTTTAATTTTTTTTTTPRPARTRPLRPVQNTGRAVAHVRPRQRQRVVQQETIQEQPKFQVEQKQEQVPRGRHVGVQHGHAGRPVSPYYYNNLKPGLLYTNTNGAYQSYYNGEIPQQQSVGLEEIEPQVIDFNIPNKLSPVRPQNENQQDFLSSFPPFVPFPSVTEQPRFQPSPVVIEQQQVSSPAPSPSSAPGSVTKTETGEVYKVGPKGRLLRKRKRVRPNRPTPPEAPQAPTPSFIQQEEPNPFVSQQEESPKFVPSTGFPPFRPSQSVITQEPFIDGPSPSPFPPTTYRPNLNALRDTEDEEADENEKPSTTTFRSRKRVKVGSAVRSTTEGSAPVSKPAASVSAAGSDEEKTKVIASRLKSLERQIRFRNRSKSS